MQGFARRYFTLYQDGILTYSFEPNQPVRDQISLHTAAISTISGRQDVINIDSSTGTFHLKCLSSQDFEFWMSAFRKFVGTDPRRSASVRRASTRRASLQISSKSNTILDEMSLSILELESAINVVRQDFKSKGEKDGATKFGIFKRSSHHAALENNVEPSPFQRIQEALTTLKEQHTALSRSIHTWTQIDATIATALPIAEEEEDHRSAKFSIPTVRRSKRTSGSTSISDLSEWFDAESGLNDGAQEFVVDADTADPSRILPDENKSTTQADDTSSVDTDVEVEIPEPTHRALQVDRRTQLPSPAVGDEGSLFSLLKKNVGKDLSMITFPVTFNEPLTLLQRTAEEFEYYSLLDEAAAITDPVERLSFIAAFAVSGYAHTRYRSGRKGFNPLLGETFEDVRMKLVAEKVRHNPVELAFHAEGENGTWELWGTSAGRTKFWGKSLEVIPLGTTHIKIGNDHFYWQKPSSFVRNLMMGKKYLEHSGKMTIHSSSPPHLKCVLDFKQSSYWAASNTVSGTVYDCHDNAVSTLEGKWDDQFAQSFSSSHLRVIWRVNPWSKNAEDYYGFTNYAMTLNEITPDIVDKLPLTDSRYRPDVRALEEGDLDLAESEKLRLEEAQRERRRVKGERTPQWFKQVGDTQEWMYIGGYWEARSKGWKGKDKIERLW